MDKKCNDIPELLSPAGDMERLVAAIDFGADAVYLSGKEFGMRTSPANFSSDQLEEAIKICHERNKKVYITCNTLPRNNEIEKLPMFIKNAIAVGVDAFIVADLGVLNILKNIDPTVKVHMSTQFGVVNYMTARALYDMGVSRIVLSRELSLEEIATIRAKTNSQLELEAFVHGSMCVSFSGRCLISNYLTGRDANRGNCSQPCRWKYSLVEEKREGEYFPVIQDDTGTYFFNSKDLCMIEHIPELLEAGITSFKIEGRAKSSYYVATITNAYKHAIDSFCKANNHPKLDPWIKEEVYKVSHREYSTGFYFGYEPNQTYSNSGYLREYKVVAVCDGFSSSGLMKVLQRNKFFKGDKLEIIEPCGKPFSFTVEKIFDEFGNELPSAPHAMQKLFLPIGKEVKKGAFIRKAVQE